jgi:hypothetical protein
VDISRRNILAAAGAAAAVAVLPEQEALGQSQDDPTSGAWRPKQAHLMTRWSRDVTPENVWPEYPRPQLVRHRWLNLNGLWNYRITDKDQTGIPGSYTGRILVPFGIESAMSGVMKPLLPHQRLWYQREVHIPASWEGQRVLLHFGAVDWEATIYVDGQHIGSHRGGYDAFSFDITEHVKAGVRHTIVVSVWDPTDTWWQPHGKQTLHPGGCSYTATSGIWQTVWLEPVPPSHIERLKMVPDLEKGVLKITIDARTVPHPLKVQAIASANGNAVGEISGTLGACMTPLIRANLVSFYKATSTWISTELELPITDPRTWSPDDPFLYDLTVHIRDGSGTVLDTVTSYFGMRSIKIGHDSLGNTRMMLNGRPMYMPGALDQGFWPDGVYLAPTDDALKFDIQWARSLGMNTVRKHVKIESQRWYYWADKLGLMVFQDMPTGWCGNPTNDRPFSPEAADQWRTEVRRHIEDNISHPCIVCWTMFNESFGGFDYLRNVAWAHQLDPSRLTNESSGFPWHGGGNVRDSHSGIPGKDPTCIGIWSEDGTPSIGVTGHEWPHAWTYYSYNPATGKTMDFLAYYNRHPKTAVLPGITPASKIWLTKKVSHMFAHHLQNAWHTALSGDFYCQIVDVETECDGLMSYDRAVAKVFADDVKGAIQKALAQARRHVPDLAL